MKKKNTKLSKQLKNKNKLLMFMLLIIIIIVCIIKQQYTNYRCRQIDYAVNKYMTGYLFNKYKLYQVESFTLNFSDGKIAMVKIQGLQKKSPHMRAAYKILMEKKKNGVWKVKKVYPDEILIRSED